VHRDAITYDLNFHNVDIVPGTQLSRARCRAGARQQHHHQAVKDLSRVRGRAFSVTDGIVEAIRRKDPAKKAILPRCSGIPIPPGRLGHN
jgi:putative glutamine amidotransferase